MIEVENYKRAIVWLRRGLIELRQEPESDSLRLGVLHRFEVTHNVSEAMLREAYVALELDEQAPYLSLRALLSRAGDEGLLLATPGQWLQYASLLESANAAWLTSATVDLEGILPILPRYVEELEAFAASLTRRMAKLA